MADIIERAEAILRQTGYESVSQKLMLIPELIAELKAARAENNRLREAVDFAAGILTLLHYRGTGKTWRELLTCWPGCDD